jgi:hypothetical protein
MLDGRHILVKITHLSDLDVQKTAKAYDTEDRIMNITRISAMICPRPIRVVAVGTWSSLL